MFKSIFYKKKKQRNNDFFDVSDSIKNAGKENKAKYDFGDWVWFLCNNELRHERIQIISIQINCNGVFIKYNLPTKPKSELDSGTWFNESQVFSTKEELINSL